MPFTSKGQVTIPQEFREIAGFYPTTEVEFEMTKKGLLLKKVNGSKSFGNRLISKMRGRSDIKMTTDEIMALTREYISKSLAIILDLFLIVRSSTKGDCIVRFFLNNNQCTLSKCHNYPKHLQNHQEA